MTRLRFTARRRPPHLEFGRRQGPTLALWSRESEPSVGALGERRLPLLSLLAFSRSSASAAEPALVCTCVPQGTDTRGRHCFMRAFDYTASRAPRPIMPYGSLCEIQQNSASLSSEFRPHPFRLCQRAATSKVRRLARLPWQRKSAKKIALLTALVISSVSQ